MAYVLIVIAFVAMGGPKDTTPTIDHMQFQTKIGCEAARVLILDTMKKYRVVAQCVAL